MNKKVTLFFCLIGLATLANSAVEAQDALANTPASQPSQPQTQPRPDVDDVEDEEFTLDEDYLEDEDYDDEYEEEGEESNEQKLAELAEDHILVKEDCQDLQNMIAQAKQSKETIDPDLEDSFQGCKEVLKEIESEMKSLSEAIFADGNSLI